MLLGLLLGFGAGAALGAGRFAYALVLPDMQAALDWSYARMGLLGSANTAGYLAGALVSHRVLYATGYRRGFYASLALQALTLAALAGLESFGPLALLRFAQGVLGAFVFVGGAAILLASGGRGVASGVYFGCVGLGIILSPLVTPFAPDWQTAWLLLAALSLLMTAPALVPYARLREPAPRATGADASLRAIRPLVIAYGLYGAGYIGYMTFVTSGLPAATPPVPLEPFWIVLGLGSVSAGFLWGRIAERLGGRTGMAVVLLVLALSSLHPLVVHAPYVSAFGFGLSFLGVVTAITVAFSATLPPGAWARAMGASTAAFALGQAVGPTVSGLAGTLAGGAPGALWSSTLLLALSFALALREARRRRMVEPPRRET